MRGKVGVAALACAVCAAIASPGVAAARTKVVYPGGPIAFQKSLENRYSAGVNDFLLKTVTINAGDTVNWNGLARFNGFHTVDLPARGQSDLPLILPSGTVSGVNDAAGSPFWFNGRPGFGFNPALFAPPTTLVYDGTKRIDSGLPVAPRPTNFKVKFTKPGVYKYFCDVHPGMVGFVVVRPKHSRAVPSARTDALALAARERHFTAEAKRLQRTRTATSTVSIGSSASDGLEVFKMFPSTTTVRVGTVVTFFISRASRETHTATFGDTSRGGYVFNLAQTAFNSNPVDPRALYPSDATMPILLSPASHGNGFANTGAMDRESATPQPPSGQIKFTQAGVYHFICLIHPFMHGTIIVR